MDINGIPVTIEYKANTFKPDEDSAVPNAGWFMYADYGYINESTSMEAMDELDVFVGTVPNPETVFLVMLTDPSDSDAFMEVKVMLNFKDADAVEDFIALQYGYTDGCVILQQDLADFKAELEQGKEKFLKMQSMKMEANLPNPDPDNDYDIEDDDGKSLESGPLLVVIV